MILIVYIVVLLNTLRYNVRQTWQIKNSTSNSKDKMRY